MIKLIKNEHTAAIHLPSAKNMPEVTLAPGVTPVGETRWNAAMENAQVCRWLKAGVLRVIEPEVILSETPKEDAAPSEPRTAAGELVATPLPPLPKKGSK